MEADLAAACSEMVARLQWLGWACAAVGFAVIVLFGLRARRA